MAMDLDEVIARLQGLNQQKLDTTAKMDDMQEEIEQLKEMISEREQRHAAEAATLSIVVEEIEVSDRACGSPAATKILH